MSSFRNQIANALDSLPSLREYDRFQEMAFLLAQPKWPGLRLTHKSHDLAADAIDDQEKLVLTCGWNGDLQKLREDCESLRKKRPTIEKVVFATSRTVEEQQVEIWRKTVRDEFGLNLVAVIHRDWIIGQLSAQQSWIAYRYLELPISDYADLKTYLPRIGKAALCLIEAWKKKHLHGEANLLDLRMQTEDADGSRIEWKRTGLVASVHPGGIVWLSGQPGSGKTLSLISLADDISADSKFQPVLVSLRQWGHHGGRLLEFVASEPAFQEQGITANTLATAVKAGQIVFLLNGWNEASDVHRIRMEDDLGTLHRQFPAATCVITARNSPSVTFSAPSQVLRLLDLSDEEIRIAIEGSGVPRPIEVSREILGNHRLRGLARVPLFLQELITEARRGNELPKSRYELLARMVGRAAHEHRALLHDLGVGLETRYLGSLAWSMTQQALTSLKADEARGNILGVSAELQGEALLAAPCSPPTVLARLSASHLLLQDDAEADVSFTHQLVQEYFAATELARRMQISSDSMPTVVNHWQWSLPVHMCVEKLCASGHLA